MKYSRFLDLFLDDMLATISRVYQCSNVDQEEFPGGVSDLSFFLENEILKEERKINSKFDHG